MVGSSFPDRKASASLTLSSYLVIVESAKLICSDIVLFRYSSIVARTKLKQGGVEPRPEF